MLKTVVLHNVNIPEDLITFCKINRLDLDLFVSSLICVGLYDHLLSKYHIVRELNSSRSGFVHVLDPFKEVM